MVLFAVTLLFSIIGTFLVRRYAVKKAIVDIPNERSSHTMPTPRGGGLAVMVTFYGALIYLYVSQQMDGRLFLALLCALPVVVVSFIDDLYPLSAKLRFGVQALSAIAALGMLGGTDTFRLAAFELSGIWINLLALLCILWMTNLFNFLDGIDGYAGSEAIFVGAGAYLLFGNEIALLIAAASLGFLFFNWHKASIFMGDVGSAPLGFIFAVLALHDAAEPSFLGWVILLSLFWFDATVTLFRRFRNGETLSRAHKKHMYQRLHQAGFSHDRVVIMGMGVNSVLLAVLWMAQPSYYGLVFCASLLLLWAAMKYVDSKRAFA